jgi:CheY-like chemotaxis protein
VNRLHGIAGSRLPGGFPLLGHQFGPRTQRIYLALRERILSGEFPPDSQLPPHTRLAAEFGVAPLTIRQVLARLADDGLLSLEQGRGTFVRSRQPASVLVVDDDPVAREIVREFVGAAGYRVVEAGSPSEALAALGRETGIALVLSDVRMPTRDKGVEFIRAVRRTWPDLPLAAVTGYPDDLAELHGTPECPVLILAKPIRVQQVQEVLRLVLLPRAAGGR